MKKKMILGLIALYLLAGTAVFSQSRHRWDEGRDYNRCSMGTFILDHGFTIADDVRIRVRQNEVHIMPEDDFFRDRVIINDDHELYINGEKIRLGKADKKLVKQYHELSYDIMDHAGEIGREGMRIGLEGARLGVKAIAGVFRLLSPGYSTDDLERDIEFEAEKIESRADMLEQDAEIIEALADKLENVHYKLRNRVKPLAELEWF